MTTGSSALALVTVAAVAGASLATGAMAGRAASGRAAPTSVASASREPPTRASAGSSSAGQGVVASRSAGVVGGAVVPRARWQWPLVPRPGVARPFVPPRSTWGAGHRGVDLVARSGLQVRAVAPGAVTHVGVIAGRPTITVTHGDGLRSTYEPVAASVRAGDVVDAGQVIGTVVVEGSHCGTAACLHLGAVRGETYLDPLTLLGPVRVRLLPLWRAGS